MSCYLLCFKKAKTFFYINWIPKILVQFCYFQRLYFGIDVVSGQDIQQPVKYETDSDNESDDEGDFEVVYSGSDMHDQVGKISTRSWLVRLAWMYADGYKDDLICTYSENRLTGVSIAIAYSFLLLRLDNYVLLISIFSVTLYKLYYKLAEFMWIHTPKSNPNFLYFSTSVMTE